MPSITTRNRTIIEVGTIIVLASIMGIVMCPTCYTRWDYFWKMELIMLTIWFVMWYGNGFVSHFINKYVSWLDHPSKRFALGIFGTALYSTLAILGLAFIFKKTFGVSIGGGWDTVWVSIGLSVAILSFLQSREFLFAWRNLALREERMRNELLVSRYEVLKNQINPHFMFNGLNALSSLIYEDQGLASKYIDHLSKVLRYVLQSGKNDVVDLNEELDILDSYIFLEKIRFNDKLEVKIALDQVDNCLVAPLVLQMLIENAIKHNEITNEHPLRISLTFEGNYIRIENAKRLKDIPAENSSKIGIENIKERYLNLTRTPVLVNDSNDKFVVQIPIITS